jgi:hypothetical protein
MNLERTTFLPVTPGLVSKPVGPGLQMKLVRSRQQPTSDGVHAFSRMRSEGVDGRDKPGHDE